MEIDGSVIVAVLIILSIAMMMLAGSEMGHDIAVKDTCEKACKHYTFKGVLAENGDYICYGDRVSPFVEYHGGG